jgi:putative spermidine/putrescine transport system permease protein
MVESRATRILLRLGAGATLAFIYLPLVLVAVYAFSVAWNNPDVREALWLSVEAAAGATVVAIVLGTLLSVAMARFAFFGRDTITLLVILPIALPGIVTGLALQTTYTTLGVSFGLLTIIIGHATFCIVVVFNNAVARMRRLHGNLEEASKDLGADSRQTFRLVTFPQLRTALLAGGLLAFALSWDEVVVTIFTSGAQQTLPIWIFANLFRPIEQPIVNVVALFVIVVSIIPVYIATRLASAEGTGLTRARPAKEDVAASVETVP